MTLSAHGKRWITSLLLLPVLGCAVYFGGWWLFALVLLVSCVGQYEFLALFRPQKPVLPALLHLCLGAALLLASMQGGPLASAGVFLAAFWIAALGFLLRFSRNAESADFTGALLLLAGLAYLPGSLQFAFHIAPLEILYLLAAVFASDTGAYYAGSSLGGPKVWPAVSPKKTWAGSCGGMLACLLVSLPFALLWQGAPWGDPSVLLWMLLAATLNLATQFGDFFESALKRTRQVKDSGAFLPGHGGVLDRIDGLLLALPVYMACRTLYLLQNS